MSTTATTQQTNSPNTTQATTTTTLIPFTHHQFGQVRVIKDEATGEPWFVAKDVAQALGYIDTKQAVRDHCKHSKLLKGVNSTPLTTSPRGITIIPQGDVYRLVARSRLPGAERFESWIFDDVLVSINKHGMYATPTTVDAMLADPDTAIRMLTAFKQEQEARAAVEAKNAALEAQIEADAHYTEFGKALEISETTITVRKLAKILQQSVSADIGERFLFQWLRHNGFLLKTRGKDWNAPSKRSISAGYMVVKTFIRQTPFDEPETTYTPYVTMKGKEYFLRTFAKMAADSGR